MKNKITIILAILCIIVLAVEIIGSRMNIHVDAWGAATEEISDTSLIQIKDTSNIELPTDNFAITSSTDSVSKSKTGDDKTDIGKTNTNQTKNISETQKNTKVSDKKSEEKATTGDSDTETMYAKTIVNVRAFPDTSSKRIGSINAGGIVTVKDSAEKSGWYKIDYNGKNAYVMGKYLTAEKPAAKR